jgi:hypothetical protein
MQAMLRTRIRRRQIAFTAWVVSLLLVLGAMYSFHRIACYGNNFQSVLLMSGTVVSLRFEAFEKECAGDQYRLTWFEFGDTPFSQKLRDCFGLPHKFLDYHPMVPLGIPLTALLALTSWRFWRRITPKGHCTACGYNLFGITSARCPECGKLSPDAPNARSI